MADIQELETQHRKLDEKIKTLFDRYASDDTINKLKLRKLALKRKIRKLTKREEYRNG